MNAEKVVELCRSCASEIYGTRPPNEVYAERVAMLLAGTVATESNLIYRRQRSYPWGDIRGAWGLWQTELAPMCDNIIYLKEHKDVSKLAGVWLYGEGGTIDHLIGMPVASLLPIVAAWDPFACLMSRVHYLRFRPPVPESIGEIAKYYKRYYNTIAGRGTPEKYIADFVRYIAPVVGAQN